MAEDNFLSRLTNNRVTNVAKDIFGGIAESVGKPIGETIRGGARALAPGLITREGARQAQDQANRSLDLAIRARKLQEKGQLKQARKLNDEAQSLNLRSKNTERLTRGMFGVPAAARFGTSTAATAAGGAALATSAPLVAGTALLSGGLRGGLAKLTGGNVAREVGKGIGEAPSIAGVGKFLNPVFNPVTRSFINNTKAARVAAGGLANVAEDLITTPAFEGRLPTITEAAISGGLGAGSKGIDEAIPTIQKLIGKKLDTSAITTDASGRARRATGRGNQTVFARAQKKAEDLIQKLNPRIEQKEKLFKALEKARVSGNEVLASKIQGSIDRINQGVAKEFGPRIREVSGFGFGFEPEYDEEGNIVGLNYDPTKGFVGFAGTTAARKAVSGELGDILSKAKSRIKTSAEINRKTFKQGFDKFYQNFVNEFQPIEDLTKKFAKENNATVLPKNDPMFAIKRLLGSGGTAELRHRQTLEPILKEIGDVPTDDFDVFLKAKRDIELSERGIIGSDKKEAERILEALGGKHDLAKMDAVAERLYKYQRESLDKLREAGFLSEDQVATITSANQKYVPFERVIGEVDGFLGLPTTTAQQATNPISKIKGSEKDILSPIESIISNTYKTEAAVAKNRVSRSIANLRNFPGFEDVIKEADKSGPNTISAWEDGVKKFYSVPDNVVEAVKSLNAEHGNLITNIMSVRARLLRQGATGRNIAFFIPNIVRDQLDAATNSKYGYRPFLDWVDGLGHVLNYKLRNTPGLNKLVNKDDDMVEQWMAAGGQQFFEHMAGRKSISKEIKDAQTSKRVTKKLYEWTIGGLDFLGDVSETPTRIGLFKRGLKATGNPDLAVQESREAALDFARMGAKVHVANSIIPFLNVGIQGFDRMIRTAKENPKGMALKVGMYAALPQTLLSLYNNLYYPDEYANVPDFVKEGNFVFMTDGKDKDGNPRYMTIPKGHIIELAANPIDNFLTYAFGKNPQTLQQLAIGTFSSALPLVGDGNNLNDVFVRTLGNITPAAIKAEIQSVSNFDFFRNQPIVSRGLQFKPPEEQYRDSTPGIYVKAGELLGMSPLKIQNYVETVLGGGPTKVPLQVFDTAKKISRGEPVDPSDVPIINRFTGSYAGFDIDRPEQSDEEGFLAKLLRPGDTAEASEDLPSEQSELEFRIKESKKILDTYNDKKDKIQFDREKSDSQKKREIEDLNEERDFANEFMSKVRSSNPEAELELVAQDTFKYLSSLKDVDQVDKKTLTKKSFTKGLNIFNSTKYSDEEKKFLLDKLEKDYGVNSNEVQYYRLAKEPVDVKAQYLMEQMENLMSQTNDRNRVLKLIASGRRVINGSKLVSDGVLDELVNFNILTRDEARDLKKFELLGKKGDVKVKSSGRGRTAKLKSVSVRDIASAQAKIKSPSRVNTASRIRIPTTSLRGTGSISPSTISGVDNIGKGVQISQPENRSRKIRIRR